MEQNYTYHLETLIDLARKIATQYPKIWSAEGKLDFEEFGEKPVKKALLPFGDTSKDFRIRVDPSEEPTSPTVNSILMTDIHERIAVIIYCKNLNECRRRFSIIKELCQLYIDPEFLRKTTTSDAQIQEAIEGLELNAMNFIKPEQAALVLAMELAMPWSHRSDIAAMQDEGQKNYDIAKKLMIPEYVIEKYFDDYGPVSDLINKHHQA